VSAYLVANPQPGTYSNSNVSAYLVANPQPGTYSNSNVDSHLAVLTSNVTTSANVSGNYFIGNGSQLTGIVSSYNNSNVATYLTTYAGNLTAGNLTAGHIYGTFVGNISGNLVVPGNSTQIIYNNAGNASASANLTYDDSQQLLYLTGNLAVTKNLNVTGNINGNGSQLTGLYSDANTVSLLAKDPGAQGYHVGNVNAGNINLTGIGIIQGSLTTVGNITSVGGYFVGNGSKLSGIYGPAFTAVQTVGQPITTPATTITSLTLKFNSIQNSNGGGYDASTGIFTAPMAGWYQVSAGVTVNPLSLSVLTSHFGSGVLGLYKNSTSIAAGPFIDLRGIIINGVATGAIDTSSVSTLVYLNSSDTLHCVLAYLTDSTTPNGSWNTVTGFGTNIIQNYFQAVWIRP
jgi:hypothetical protein